MFRHSTSSGPFTLFRFVHRAPGMSAEEFHDRWRNQYSKLLLDCPAVHDHVKRYEQNHRTARDYDRPEAFVDGVAVLRLDSRAAYDALLADPHFRDTVRAEERALFDPHHLIEVPTEQEEVIIEGPAVRPPATKLICGVTRKRGMDLNGFHDYWRAVHGPLNRTTKSIADALVRYEQHHRVRSDYSRPECTLDGVTVQWYRSAREFYDMIRLPEYDNVIHRDEGHFLDRDGLVWLLTSDEEVIIQH